MDSGSQVCLFDTNLDACARACSANEQCIAFTFNSRSNACFPKSAINEQQPYQGALSARKISTEQRLLEAAPAIIANLNFLTETDLTAASQQAVTLGLRV